MSDNADRFMLDVVMESVPHRDIDGQETASSSASAEDCSDFFDFDAYYSPGVETDVTTPPSEGEPAGGSLPLAQGTTLAKNPSHVEDTPMPDAPAQESQSLNLWPQLSGPQPPRDKVIFLESSPSPQPSGEMSPKGPARVRSASGQRTRVIKDLDKTNKVRERGACYHCKINKKGCDDAEICKECSKRFEKKPSCSKRACIRKPLKEMIPPKLGRWNWANPSLLMPGRNQFEAGAESVFCSLSVDGPYLELRASRFTLANERQNGVQSFQGVGIMPSDLPSDENIYLWMERQILAENKPSFEAYMDKLLVGLASQQRARPQPWAHQIPEQLVLETLRMRCMCKVWSAEQLFLEQRRAQISPFDIRFASMKDSLRLLAGRRISELERKITEDLEKYLGRKEPASTHPMILVVKCK
ncbi:uncharacterized protein P884DRAFT_192423 [Thermothelomyces heterothallicus CBS 202.75]|uniref:uncharacterized protein n=1 Tax=Thermothelomyces heterothallicus CBS 202.75 TaxID=1149848 RepID=UPI0037427241